jgi:protein phosphatase
VPAETVERPYLGGAAASDAAAPAAAPSELTAPDAGRRRRRLTVLIAIAVLLAALAAAAGIVGQLEWVGVSDDGVVTVYRGVPFEFAGLRLYREHRRTATPYAELDEEQQARVDAHAVGWRGSGEDLATELQSGIP